LSSKICQLAIKFCLMPQKLLRRKQILIIAPIKNLSSIPAKNAFPLFVLKGRRIGIVVA
jgi:hypothetical protein